ncbi:MAG: universal stress protein [Chitinophagales bacterium]
MNKVILLSGTDHLPAGACDFVSWMNQNQRLLLATVFLPKVDSWDVLLFNTYGVLSPGMFEMKEDPEILKATKQKLYEFCEKNDVEFRIHEKEFDDLKSQLCIESRFADLMVFSNDAFYQSFTNHVYDEFADNTLHHAECPVIIVPQKFERPKSVILAYDGSASSVFAIRQFAALFPELAQLETLLVYIDSNKKHQIPDLSYIEELAARHFNKLTFLKLNQDPGKSFADWIEKQPEALLVTGAQGRGAVSELLHKSFIGEVLKKNRMPVFVTHR